MKKFILSAAALLSFLTLFNVEAKAQFYTVDFISHDADSLSSSTDPYANGLLDFPNAKLSMKEPTKKHSQEKGSETTENIFSLPKRKVMKTAEIPLFDTTDSLMLDLIRKRLTVCMPLDLVHINSPYGYRKDPFKQCQKFHDGIDLKAGHELVFSMLPGKVAEVRHGNTGYGNYVILDHGKLRCLYGHLGDIMVKEGSIVDAGTAIGYASNTGRSTGVHLHLRLSKLVNGEWTSVDPLPFINSLNDYINKYNEKLDILMGKDRHKENLPELTIANLYAELQRQGVKHPKIVLAQAILESGNFRSRLTFTHNNIFGIRKRNGDYQSFEHWSHAVTAYRDLVQYKYREGKETYMAFLSRIGYASDPSYANKVMDIANTL